MKRQLLLAALSLSGLVHAQTYSNNTVTTIPDGTYVTGGCGSNATPGTVSSLINVPISGNVSDPIKVTFTLDITHSWLGDIVAEIIKPGQTSGCALIKRVNADLDTNCGSLDNFVAGNILSFNSANTTTIPISGNPATGNYAPTGPQSTTNYPATVPLCDLATFINGTAVNGNWTLKMYDNGAGDVGQLNAWSIVFATGALGEQEFTFSNSISVLGNPFENELVLMVNDPSARSAKLSLYTIDGKLVSVRDIASVNNSENISVNTSSFSSGMYVLVPELDGRKMNSIKLIKK